MADQKNCKKEEEKGKESPKFFLPSTFQTGPFSSLSSQMSEHAHQTLMQLRFVCYFEEEIHSFFEGQDDCFQEEKDNFHKILANKISGSDCGSFPSEEEIPLLLSLSPCLLSVISLYNRKKRTKSENNNKKEKDRFPVQELVQIEKENYKEMGLLPPPSPVEYVEEKYTWFKWGEFSNSSDFIGHGWFWRPQPPPSSPSEEEEKITNMATTCMNDYDLFEDNFFKLKKASVIVADYGLLKHDFPELKEKNEEEIDRWLVDNAAFLSSGQVERISEGGDHYDLLGIKEGGVEEWVEKGEGEGKRCCGVRTRSGGRAASFLLGGEYWFDDGGYLQGRWLEVKGIGTHKRSAFAENPKNTGLLNLADALREFAVQRMIQRLCDNDQTTTAETVKFYAILDTGLQYGKNQLNPCTGWTGEKCVLAVRQRHSRAFVNYEGYNFSGNLLMSGENYPSPSMLHGCAGQLRKTLVKAGVSAEVTPLSVFKEVGKEREVCEEQLSDLTGMWNIQSDAAISHFMDFSDYFTLPFSPIKGYRMSQGALKKAITLERKSVFEKLIACPSLCQSLFGCESEEVKKKHQEYLVELSKDETLHEACSKIENGVICMAPPKFCMCWFMELDDSPMSKWALSGGNDEKGAVILERIEKWLE